MNRYLLIALFSCICTGVRGDSIARLPVSQGPYQIEAADLNADGALDILVPCRGDLQLPDAPRPGNDILTVYLTAATSATRSAAPHARRDFNVGFGPYTAAVGDLDGDGLPDAAVANFQEPGARHLSILWGAADRAAVFDPDAPITIEGAPFAYSKNFTPEGRPAYAAPGLTSVGIADFNGDRRLDLVAVAYSSDFFVVLLNQGSRRFSQTRVPLLIGPRDVAIADFNNDGHPDLAFTIYSCNLVQVFLGDGRGGFSEWCRFFSEGQVPYHLKAADLDRDGLPDLVVGNRGVSDNACVFHNTGSGFQFAGSFATDTPVTAESTTDEIRDVFLTDADGDGMLDLFAACHFSSKVIFWRGTGDLAFGKAFTARRVRQVPGQGSRALARLGDTLAIVCYGSSEVILAPIADWLAPQPSPGLN